MIERIAAEQQASSREAGALIRQAAQPADGYRLAAGYCEHHDGRYGTTLNGPAKARVQAIADFVAEQEVREAKARGSYVSLGV